MIPRWLFGVASSIALHTALALAVIALVRVEQAPTGLIVDLSAIVAGSDDGAVLRSGAPAPRMTNARAGGGTAITGSRRPRKTPRPPATAPATDAAPRREESAPTPSHETAAPAPTPPASSGAASLALAPEPDRASAPGSSADTSEPEGRTPRATGSGSASGGTESGAAGIGGVGREPIAALGVSGGGGAGSDYAAYYARLRQRIQDVLRYPAVARRRGVTGTVHLEIAVEPDGAIGAVSVIASSSHKVLDRAALDAARAVPRVPFPGDVRPRALRVRLPVVFELR